MGNEWDAIVVGAGPNGLTAAAVLARAGRSVLVVESADTIGGGTRTDEAFGTGIRRDVCAAVHPTGFSSPAFAELGVSERVEWCVPDVSFAHAFSAADGLGVYRDPAALEGELGGDAAAWRRTVGWDVEVAHDVLGMPGLPRRPLSMAGFGPLALAPLDAFTRSAFRDERVRTTFAAVAAHAGRPTRSAASTAPGLLLGLLAAPGWPVAAGGSQSIADALAAIVRENGGAIETGSYITDFDELPAARQYFFDVSPRALTAIMGDRLPSRYRRRLDGFTYGGGVCKVDFLLREPIPWTGRGAAALGATATFHIARDRAQIRATEDAVAAGRLPERPWVLGGEPTRVDRSRAPAGTHLAWAYCHVPAGCEADVSDLIVAEIERCAPGFSDLIAERTVMTAAAHARYNPNCVGGDINCGAASLRQLLARPVPSLRPHETPVPGVYLCSSAAAPGGGVHGMSGYRAAKTALERADARRR
ncbi:phytoene desaturase family protein [Gordonia neofelifaecis]|uniref:FAD dependent oxidoreductase n=1 Tax=Gordonia neofelifaecis NRRL B-59395 TaxID=644548 RepID=F1YL60_9ACTN|nr:NAD(P)/FAD-dependent oxidoreductase [Gordonia neofelifaecis]EGD54520.1 FAD dependent oxidoreductase [Gordonia neofelifaecis NRRL B-59395]